MSGRHRTCEICGIKERNVSGKLFFARFPLERHRCADWVKVVAKEDLAYLPIKKLHDLRYVCEIHFSKRDFTKTGTRPKKRAVPKLHLTSKAPLSDSIIAEFLQINSQDETPEVSTVPESPVFSTLLGQTHGQDQVAQEPLPSSSVLETSPLAGTSSARTRTELSVPSKLLTLTHTVGTQNQVIQKPLPSTSALETSPDPATPSTSKGVTESKPKKRKITKEDLTPLELELLEKLQKANASIKSLKKNAKLIDSLESPALRDIVMMTLKNQKRKPRGRRWTTKYKISLLAIFKRSPKTYKYLKYLVPLPSVNTITNILKKIPMEPGICQNVVDVLKKKCPKDNQERACCLLFDEMAIKPRLIYNNATDKIEGYTDLGNGKRHDNIADHALVFMIQGLKKKFKQPVAFYFVKGTIPSGQLASVIREVIQTISETGYNVLGTVCDQGPTNMGALKILKDTFPTNNVHKNTFTVNEKPVHIIYDVPHLFKSIRNNFLNYGAIMINGKIAKWDHLQKVEEKNRNLLYLSKISQIHVQPKYRAKMKVKYAAQILSNTVAAVLKLISLAEQDRKQSSEIMDTAHIIQDLNKLFDYTNGPSGPQDIKKGLRQNVSNKTDHIQVWTDYRKKLETVKFLKLATGARATNVRCIQGYLVTLCSLRDIWAECQRLGFKYLNLRQLNQDSLENLFGVIRQHSPTNRNPTVSSFMAAIKTAIVSRLTAPHSRGANCQNDTNTLLTDFHDIVFNEENVTAEKENILDVPTQESDSLSENFPVLNISDFEDDDDDEEAELNLDKQPVAYLSGYIASRVIKKHKCLLCKETLIADPDNASNNLYAYIKLREWWTEKKLTYPSHNLFKLVESCVHDFERELLHTMHIANIRLSAITLFMTNSNLNLGCSLHSKIVTEIVMTDLAVLLIRRQCNRVNKKMALDEEHLADLNKKFQQSGHHH